MRKSIALFLAAALLLPGCVKVDNSLGSELVDKSLLFQTYTVSFPLTEIQMKKADDLSGFSATRLTLGAIRDDIFGLTTRSAAFPLIPVLDTIDLGTNPKPLSFNIYFEADTVSCADDTQQHIFQNVYVTELTKPLTDYESGSVTQDIAHGTKLITTGLPIINGQDPLRFSFTKEFAQHYIDEIKKLGPVFKERSDDENAIDKYEDYLKALPGIYLETDVPEGNGGRISMFDFSCLSVSSNYYYRNSNVAILKVNSTWNGVQKDSSFMFIPGETTFEDEVTALNDNTGFYQYCFNRTTHSTVEGAPTDKLLVEGGGGLKPVIKASELREKTRKAISDLGYSPDKAVIVKATITLPFALPEKLEALDKYPSILSPTIRQEVEDDEGNVAVGFAGLTDASVSSENQGDIDLSNHKYAPDITYHVQEILSRTDLDTATDADIWLLTVHTEKVADASGSLYDDEYYQQLLYANYYNSLYGGGYGYGGYGYGSYGYGGYNSYSNYYSYMMLAQMMASSTQQSYSVTSELDKERYYCGILGGPQSDYKPMFQITFSVSKE